MSLHEKSIEELHELLVNKELTVVELIESTFEYIDAVEPTIGAFINTDKESALTAAQLIDERGVDVDNVLDGIPVAVKDNIVTKEGKRLRKCLKTCTLFMMQQSLKRLKKQA